MSWPLSVCLDWPAPWQCKFMILDMELPAAVPASHPPVQLQYAQVDLGAFQLLIGCWCLSHAASVAWYDKP